MRDRKQFRRRVSFRPAGRSMCRFVPLDDRDQPAGRTGDQATLQRDPRRGERRDVGCVGQPLPKCGFENRDPALIRRGDGDRRAASVLIMETPLQEVRALAR